MTALIPAIIFFLPFITYSLKTGVIFWVNGTWRALKFIISSLIYSHSSLVLIAHHDDFLKVYSMIEEARSKAWQQVNKALIELYWNIGRYVSKKIKSEKWGNSVVEKMSIYI